MKAQMRAFVAGGSLLALCATSTGCAQLLAGGPWGLASGLGRDADPSYDELVRSADRFRERGDLERAQVGYLRAWQREPRRPLARIRLAQLQLLHDPERAAAGFENVLALAPDEARAWNGLGVAALALGRVGEAERAFAEASRRAPESALAHAGRAVALDLMGEAEAAGRELAKAREMHPDDAWLLNNLGVSRMLAQDWSGAEAALRAALELDSTNAAARNNLGLALGGQERYAEALDVFAEAGDERSARNNLGYVYFLNGRHAEAVKQYEMALAADGEDAHVVLKNLNAALDAMDGKPARRHARARTASASGSHRAPHAAGERSRETR